MVDLAGAPLLLVVATAAFVGLLGGVFGKGGSAVATPLLAAAGVPAMVAVAAPLPATIPATFVAASTYRRAGHVDRRLVRTSIAVGVPATVVGALLTTVVPPNGLVAATEVLVALIGLRLLLAPSHRRPTVSPAADLPTAAVVTVAVAVGLASGLLANSGGFLLAPLYLVALRLPVKRAFGSSLAVACVLALPGAAVHGALGHLDVVLVVAFAAVSTPMSLLGAHLALRLRSERLERSYGGLLTALATVLLVAHA